MDKARQEQIVNGARTVNSRDEMRNYVESIAKCKSIRERSYAMYQSPTRQEPLETPGKNSTYGDGDIPEIDLPSSDNASPEIPQEFPQRQTKIG